MKRTCWFIFVVGIVILFTLDLNAQNSTKNEFLKLGFKTDTLMYGAINKGQYITGLELCKEKEEYFRKAESWENYVISLNDKAWLYHFMDSLELLKKAVFVNFEMADKYLKSDNSQWLRAKEQVNSYYYKIGDYKSALEIIKEVIPIKEKKKLNKIEIANSYLSLGAAYNHLRDTENALSSFKKSIKVLYGDGDVNLRSGERYNNIGRVYKSMGQLDSALYYLNISEGLFDTINMKGRFKRRKIETHTLLVDTWLEKKDYEKAKFYLDLLKTMDLSHRGNVQWNEKYARYYREIEDFNKAEFAIRKANELAIEYGIRDAPPIRSRRMIELAKILKEKKEDDEALHSLQKALQILSPIFKEDDIHSNPISENLLDKPDALTALQEKARILKDRFDNLDSIKYLESSFQTYLIACDVIKDVRQGIRSTDSKNDLSERTISVYEEAIAVAHDLYKLTKDNEHISIAFKLAESNKAQLLLENLNEQEARGFAGIPDSLFKKEKGLRLYLATLQDRAIRNGEGGGTNDRIFQAKQETEQFASFLEKTYPRYYQLKYNNEPVDPFFVQQNLLDNSTALIEYFVGVNKIYFFTITKDSIYMDELEKNAEELKEINELRNILKSRPGTSTPENEYTSFVNSSQAVYNSFVSNVIKRIPPSVNSLIIIPDDQLNYIPFEILLVAPAEEEFSYSIKSQSYLFEKYAINYNYSATLLNKVISKESTEFMANFIGYAPTFSENTKGERGPNSNFILSDLKCNEDEVSNIRSIIGGSKKVDERATKNDFLAEAKNYKIIHLATHAFVDPNDSKLNRIFLQDDFLSDVNLYNLELNTELAVLSACNTGSGELLKGEGVMNLARGFINAGCSSTLMSMWAVDDCATSDLMLLFYKELKKGLTKDEALRKAKIRYLNTANKTKMHPYYWAAFIPFGDMKSLEIENEWFTSSALSILFGLIALGLVFFYFKRK